MSIRPSRTRLLAIAAAAAACLTACSKTDTAARPAGIAPSPGAPGSLPPPPPAPPAPPPPPPPAAEVETAPSAPDAKASVSGTITLPAARKGNVAKSDIIFLVARRAGGSPGPGSMLAVQKIPVGDFPMPFVLSGRDAMIPGTPFEGEISITVRLDKDGDAMTRKKGDLYGVANGVKVGSQGITIPLESLQAEDQVLGGGAAGGMGAGAPSGRPGLPPGHP